MPKSVTSQVMRSTGSPSRLAVFAPGSMRQRTVRFCSSSFRTTALPMKPVAPVTAAVPVVVRRDDTAPTPARRSIDTRAPGRADCGSDVRHLGMRDGARAIAAPGPLLVALRPARARGCEKKADADRAGRQNLFATTCARCHGADGTAAFRSSTAARRRATSTITRSSASHTDEQIKLTIVNGKGVGMPPFGTTFTDAQLDALVAHVRSFDSEKSGK